MGHDVIDLVAYRNFNGCIIFAASVSKIRYSISQLMMDTKIHALIGREPRFETKVDGLEQHFASNQNELSWLFYRILFPIQIFKN